MAKATYTFRRDPDRDLIHVDGQMACGQIFQDVVTIVEASSVNPGFRINNPTATLGIDGVEMIVRQFRTWKGEVDEGIELSDSESELPNFDHLVAYYDPEWEQRDGKGYCVEPSNSSIGHRFENSFAAGEFVQRELFLQMHKAKENEHRPISLDEITVDQVRAWNVLFDLEAKREGWMISNNADDEYCIVMVGDPQAWIDDGWPLDYSEPKFRWDEDAVAHVKAAADDGSLWHEIALQIHEAHLLVQ